MVDKMIDYGQQVAAHEFGHALGMVIGVCGGVLAGILGIGIALAVADDNTASAEESVSATSARDPQALAQGVEVMQHTFDTIDMTSWDWELREALPNVLYSIDGKAPKPASDLVVVGTVTATKPGPGFVDVVGVEGVPMTEVAFDSPKAAWSVMHLTLAVERTIGSQESAPATLEVEVVLGPQPSNAVMLKALSGQRVLAFLNAPGTNAQVDASAYTVSRGGMGLGLIADDGTMSMPYLGVNEEQYIGSLTTLDAVLAEATKATTLITTDLSGERADRSTYPSWSGLN